MNSKGVKMANPGTRYIVRCLSDFSIKINKTKLMLFKKRKDYNCVLENGSFIIYGDEYSYHCDKNNFKKHFKILKPGRF